MDSIIYELNGGAPSAFSAAPTSTATQILTQANRRTIAFYNNGTVPVYIDTKSSVLTTTGVPIMPGKWHVVYQSDPNTSQNANCAWWGIVSGATSGDIRGIQSV